MKAATNKRRSNSADITISIHAAREGGDWDAYEFKVDGTISIHAAREGGDEIGIVYV